MHMRSYIYAFIYFIYSFRYNKHIYTSSKMEMSVIINIKAMLSDSTTSVCSVGGVG